VDLRGRLAGSEMGSQPVRDGDGGTVGIILLFVVAAALATPLFSLPGRKGPINDNAISLASAVAVGVGPVTNTFNLLHYLLGLLHGVLLLVAVSAALIMFTAVVNPDALGNLTGAQLVPAEDVGNQLATVCIRITVFHVLARDVEILVAAATAGTCSSG